MELSVARFRREREREREREIFVCTYIYSFLEEYY